MSLHGVTWGDELTLIAASVIFRAEIVIISSVKDDACTEIVAPVAWKVPVERRLIIGHYHEYHYTSVLPMQSQEYSAAVGVISPSRIGISAFFARQSSGLRTEQEHDRAFRSFEWNKELFCIDACMDASLTDFFETMERAIQNNIRLLHLGGHSDSARGFYWQGETTFDSQHFAGILVNSGANIECIFLNTCFSINIAKEVISSFASGVGADRTPVVIGWAGAVKDSASLDFVRRFYRKLQDCNPNSGLKYIEAYKFACHAMAGQANWCIDPASDYCTGVPCLLHRDSTQNVISYQGHKLVAEICVCGTEQSDHLMLEINDEGAADGEGGQNNDSTEDPERSMNNQKGKKEVQGLKHLGFEFEFEGAPISMDAPGHGTKAGRYANTVFIKDDAVREVFGLSSACGYTHENVWNPTTGAIVLETKARLAAGECSMEDLQSGVSCLRESLALRQSQAAKGKSGARGRGRGKGEGKGKDGHMFILNQMDACISQLETLAAAPPEVVAAPAEEQAATQVASTPSVNAVPFVPDVSAAAFVPNFSATAFVPTAAHKTLSWANSESLC